MALLGPLLFLLYTADLFEITGNDLVGYADDATLMVRVRSPRDRSASVASVNKDLTAIHIWCIDWGMSLNIRKTHAMIVSRSRTFDPPFPPILVDGVEIQIDSSLTILGLTFDGKLTFEAHLRNQAGRLSQQLGLLRKCWKSFGDTTLVRERSHIT